MKGYIKYGLIGYLPSILLISVILWVTEIIVVNQRSKYSSYWLGKQFDKGRFYNSNGDSEVIDVGSTEYTVLDFWFAGCSPCIAEMRGFGRLLKNDSNKLKIYSISIDKFSLWQKLTTEDTTHNFDELKFLSNPIPNWTHLSIFDPNNSKDSIADILDKYHIDTFPTYLILNQKGYVVDIRHRLISASSNEFKINEPNFINYYIAFFKSGTKNILKVIRAFSLLYFALYTFGFLVSSGINKLKSQRFASKQAKKS